MLQLKTKLLLLSLIIIMIPSIVLAGINLEINNNIQVETSGGSEVELSGNLIENGTGYLNGKVTSGTRTSVTQFAGLSISSALNGTITRITGTQYSGTGTNFTRYYEINNQSTTTDLTANDTVKTISSEAGSLTGPFFLYTKNGSSWRGYGFGSTGTTIEADTVTFPKNSQTDLVISAGVGVKAKIFLEGPYNTTNHNMNLTLNPYIPLTSPYPQDARTVASIPSSAVDWVLVQLRDATTPSTIIASRSAFLDENGNLIDDNATSGSGIGIAAPPGNYYIVIEHRNHLAVMTASAQTGLTWGTASTVSNYDFTTSSSQFYGGADGAIELESGVWGMISGDGDGNGQVQNYDSENIWKPDNGTSGYKNSDFNLNGQVQNNDNENYWKPNNGRGTQVPNS